MTIISKKVFTSSNYRLFMLPAFMRAFLFKSSPSGELSYNTKKLALSNSSYSNYENGYSEPPAEIIIKFCDILKITMSDLLELKVTAPQYTTVRTFADLISILIDLDRRGLSIKGTTTYSQHDNQLMAHLTLDIKNAQIATFIPDWNEVNKELASGMMDEDEYQMWLEDTLRLFNVQIDDYVYK